jgi:aerotaxis receptor
MPKVVFKLFWDYLNEGKPIFSYFKNKTKSGRYYWVLAMAFPIPNGFISIRLKPSTDMFKTVAELYNQLLEREKSVKDFDANISFFENKLKELGFNSYDKFMTSILTSELVKRSELLYRNDRRTKEVESKDVPFRVLPALSEAVQELIKIERELQGTFVEIDLISKNMLFGTIHLGKIARTAATVSENLQLLTDEMRAGSVTFHPQLQKLFGLINQSILEINMIYFQNEMLLYPKDEKLENDFEISEGEARENIRKNIFERIQKINKDLKDIKEVNNDLMSVMAEFTRISLGMNVICISGKIEIAHISNHAEISIDNIQDVSEQLDSMKTQNEIVKTSLNGMNKLLLRAGSLSSDLGFYLSRISNGS